MGEKVNYSDKIIRVAKVFGKALSIIAIIYVIKKIIDVDMPIKTFATKKSMLWLTVLIATQVAKLFLDCLPWRYFIQAFSKQIVPYRQTVIVYLKSNILKYVPGNIFQYVGRNELAIKLKISHNDVILATVFEVGTNFGMALIIAMCMMGERTWNYLKEYSHIIKILTLAIVGLLILVVFFGMSQRRNNRIRETIENIKFHDWVLIGKSAIYLGLFHIIGGIQFLAICFFVLNIEFGIDEVVYLLGAYILAFVVGFITPGASGGMGVKEGVMIFFVDNMMPSGIIALAMVISRVIGIVGDILAYLIVKVMECNKRWIE